MQNLIETRVRDGPSFWTVGDMGVWYGCPKAALEAWAKVEESRQFIRYADFEAAGYSSFCDAYENATVAFDDFCNGRNPGLVGYSRFLRGWRMASRILED